MRRLGLLMGSVWFKLWRAAALPLVGAERSTQAALRRWRAATCSACRRGRGGGALARRPRRRCAPAIAALLAAAAPDATGGGSNNWAVGAGALTDTGRPVLAGDPHRVFEMPNMYAQGHLACPDFDAIGLTVPGVPGFPHFAQNGQRRLVRHPCLRRHPRPLPGALRRRARSTRCSGRMGAGGAAARRRSPSAARRRARSRWWRRATARSSAATPRAARRWRCASVQFAETDLSFDCLPRMLRAARRRGAVRGDARLGVDRPQPGRRPTRPGTSAGCVRARVPRRGRENGWLPVPGWTGAHEWQGWIPHEAMPRADRPARRLHRHRQQPRRGR